MILFPSLSYETNELPETLADSPHSLKKLNPDFEYMFWTDEKSRELLEKHYDWFLPVYDSYPFHIQKAEAMRYFILSYFGGN